MSDRSFLPLVFIPDTRFGAGRTREEMAAAALEGGASAVQLRDKGVTLRALLGSAGRLAALCRERGRPFFVNDRVDLALAVGADGVHLGPGDLPPRVARRLLGNRSLIGVSVYRTEDIREAEAAGAAYVAVGAMYPTDTKRIEVVGLEGVRRVRAETKLPLVAIGGIGVENVAEVIRAGADGVALVSWLSGAADIAAAARELRAHIATAR